MKILILGGTSFVGYHAAIEAVARGHDVTLFNRGNHAAPQGARSIVGDRLTPEGYAGLDGLSFDVVIDTWATEATAVKLAIDALRGRTPHYIFISTVAVYDFDKATAPFTEDTPLCEPETSDHPYVRDKTAAERFFRESGTPTALIRPGIILGSHENIGRLPWWLARMKKGGKTIAPGPQEAGLQFVDVRDLAAFTLLCAEKKLDGGFNLVSEQNHATMLSFLETCNKVAGNHAELCWKTPQQLEKAGVKPFSELPLWIPATDGEIDIYSIDVSKAISAGLTIRPAEDTIRDTWEWMADLPTFPNKGVGLDPDKEKQALDTE